MKSDFVIALTQLAAERNLPKEVILRTLEAALATTFKKDSFAGQNVSVKVMPQTGEVKIYVEKVVVEKVIDPQQEISLSEARTVKGNISPGETIQVESASEKAGRIIAQTIKQVMLQRLREAERDTIFSEYADKEGDIVSGTVQYIDPKQIIINLGKAEAVLPLAEQVPTEHYRIGQRLKLYLLKVSRSNKGSQLVVSRSHPGLLRRLFELEVPEIYSGIVELKAVAREAGYRSKIAVATKQPGVDPVGCCVGLRSIRIQNITKELNGERIDIILWDPDLVVFISNTLSPASVAKVEINEKEKIATVVVPDKQLSLAIGKGGQNARLAAKLTGWRIDIKSLSVAEAEEKAYAEEVEQVVSERGELVEHILEPTLIAPETEPILSPIEYPIEEVLQTEPATTSPKIRFAEEILPEGRGKLEDSRKGKTKEVTRLKKARRIAEDEEYEE